VIDGVSALADQRSTSLARSVNGGERAPESLQICMRVICGF